MNVNFIYSVIMTEFDKLGAPLFAEGVTWEAIVNKIPKDTRTVIKELLAHVEEKNLPLICTFIEERGQEIGLPKFTINKKSEKVYTLAQKYFIEEKLKTEENNPTRVGLFFAEVLMGSGVYTWPFYSKSSTQSSNKTLWKTFSFIKDNFNEKHWQCLEKLYEIGIKDASEKNDKPELKALFKELAKLI